MTHCPIIYSGEYSKHIQEEHALCILSDWIFCRYLLGSFGLECTLFPTFPSWFPIYITYHCWKHNTEVPTSGKEPACNAGDTRDEGFIPGSGRSPGGRHGNSLQHSCLQNPTSRRAWWASVHGVTKIGHDWATKYTCTIILVLSISFFSIVFFGSTICLVLYLWFLCLS